MERLTLRLSSSEKEMIDAYCEKKEMTVNAALRGINYYGAREKLNNQRKKLVLSMHVMNY